MHVLHLQVFSLRYLLESTIMERNLQKKGRAVSDPAFPLTNKSLLHPQKCPRKEGSHFSPGYDIVNTISSCYGCYTLIF